MSRKKIVVTGAGGFIGFELGNYLATRGHSVVGVDLSYPSSGEVYFDAQRADFREEAKMSALLKGVDVVFHLASAHLDVRLDQAEYWDVNVHSLPTFLALAQAREVAAFIHVSSVGVYGHVSAGPADEETPCFPQSIYGETKLAGEAEVKKFSETTGFPTVILRPTWVYGPTCPRTRKLYRALRKRTFVMIGPGDNLRHPIYIKDLLDAFRLVMDRTEAHQNVFIVGGEQILTTRDVVQMMCNVFHLKPPLVRVPHWMGAVMATSVEIGFRWIGSAPPISRRTLEFFRTNNAFDITKAKQLLAFKPGYSFEEGLSDCRTALEASA